MSRFIELTAADGHRLRCYEARAAAPARGAVVVLQEIFGVNEHIRTVCERVAAEGYDAYAPALFDRTEPGFESGYSPDEIARARGFLKSLDWDALVADTLAAVQQGSASGRVALMGFCLGGSVAWVTAQRSSAPAAAICYYGGQIASHLDRAPQCPTLLHFGEQDHSIPMESVDKVRQARPEAELHVYPAGHGFNRDVSPSYEPASAALAWERTREWLRKYVG